MKKLFFCILLLSSNCFGQSNTFKWVNNTSDFANPFFDYRGNSMAVSPSGTNYYTGSFASTVDFDRGPGVQELTSTGSFDICIAKYDENGEYIWAKKIGDANDNRGFVITLDNDENILTAGMVGGSPVDFDLGPGVSTLSSSFYIAKYDSSFSFQWVVPINYVVYHIETDDNGNVLVTGKDIISKYDSFGILLWSHTLTNITGRSIATYPNGDVVLSGYFGGTIDFDPSAATYNLTAVGTRDAFLVKYDASGNFLWAFETGGNSTSSGFDEASSVVIDSNGDICVVGMFASTVDFDPGPGVQNLSASFLSNRGAFYFAKYDLNGNYIFAYRLLQSMQNFFLDQSPRIAIDLNDNLYITGWHWGGNVGTVNTINLTSNGGPDIFVAKYLNSGADLWAFSIGGGSTDLTKTINVDQNENIYINGGFNPLLDFNPHPSFTNNLSTGSNFFAKYGPCIDADIPTLSATTSTICIGDSTIISVNQNDDLNDALVWRLYDGGCGIGSYIAENDSGSFVVYPNSNTTYSVRGESGGCVSLGSCGEITIDVNPTYNQTEAFSICSGGNYTFPDGVVENGIITQMVHVSNLTTTNGCDSIITTTINPNPTYNLIESFSICAGGNYTFPDGSIQSNIMNQVIYISNLTTINGCDSIITTTITPNPTYNLIEVFAICSGENYTFPDGSIQSNILNQVVHVSNLQTVAGCDSIITTTLNVNPTYFYYNSIDICQGDSVLILGNYENTTNLYYDSLQTVSSCDSVYHVQLNVHPTYVINQNETICSNDSIYLQGAWQNTMNFYYDTLQTVSSCDSIIITFLDVNPTSNSSFDTSFCVGTSVVVNGTTYNQSGVFYQNFSNIYGCDSVLTVTITENPLPNANIGPDTLLVCDGEVLGFGLDSTTGIVNYTIGNFTTLATNDSLIFIYDALNAPSSVVSQVTDINGCVNNDQVILKNNAIQYLQIGVPSFNDPSLTFTIANMPDNVDSWYWSFGDGTTLTTGEVNPTHEYTSNGNYEACLIGTNTCGVDSSCITFTISTVGVDKFDLTGTKVYPNPMQNQLTITTDNLKIERVEILDGTGKIVYKNDMNFTAIDVSNLHNGIYFVKIYTDKGVGNKRIIKN